MLIIRFNIPNELLHFHADVFGLLLVDEAKTGWFISPEGKTEQKVNFLTRQRRVGDDVPEV